MKPGNGTVEAETNLPYDELYEQSINFVKAHTHPVRIEQVFTFCNIADDYVGQRCLVFFLANEKRIRYLEDVGTVEYINVLGVHSQLELIGYLVLSGPGHQVYIDNLCDGWWDCYPSIYELEKNGVISITRIDGYPVFLTLKLWNSGQAQSLTDIPSQQTRYATDELDPEAAYESDGYDPEQPLVERKDGRISIFANMHYDEHIENWNPHAYPSDSCASSSTTQELIHSPLNSSNSPTQKTPTAAPPGTPTIPFYEELDKHCNPYF